MEPSDLLRHLVEVLGHLGVRYLVTGSTASAMYGEPRFTNDIDVVVDLRLDQVPAFCAAFPSSEYYCSRDAVEAAIRQRFQFNILHPTSGVKIDVIIPTDSEFDKSRLTRGQRLPVTPDLEAHFASPEDVILKKLQYYEEGGSEKHVRDIAGMMRVLGERVDLGYLEQWAKHLNVWEVWQEVQQQLKASAPPES